MATWIKAGFWENLCKNCKGYRGWLNLDEFVKNNVPSVPYKVYRALLGGTDGEDPTVTILENTLGGTPTWTRQGGGLYWCELAGAFPFPNTPAEAKVFCLTTPGYSCPTQMYFFGIDNTDRIVLYGDQDEDLNNLDYMDMCVEIRVYP